MVINEKDHGGLGQDGVQSISSNDIKCIQTYMKERLGDGSVGGVVALHRRT